MKLVHLSLFLVTLSLAVAPERVAASAPEPWAFEISDLKPDPRVTWGTLENGVRYVVMPNQEPRERVSLRLYMQAGSLDEKEEQRGVAHFLEHLGFNGTENFGPGTLVEYFQRLGMSFGADTNAYTSFNRTVYMIELPDPAPGALDEGLLVLRDYAGRMLLNEEQIDSERGVILSEMRSRESVGYRTAVAEYGFLMPEARIPERFPIGVAEVLKNVKREDFLEFYETWYRPERTVLVVVGDVDPKVAVEMVTKNFEDFVGKREARPDPDMGEIIETGFHAALHTEVEAPSTSVSIQALRPYERQPDTAERRIALMHRAAASQILSRRLDRLAREEDAVFSRGVAYGYDAFDFVTNAGIELTCEPGNWEGSLRVAEQELRRVLEHGFQEVEVRVARADLLNAYEESVRREATRQSSGLAESLISSVDNGIVFTNPETELELMRSAIEEMSVEDVQRALEEVWAPEGRYVFLSGNLTLENAETQILEVYEASRTVEVEAPEDLAEMEFAYTDFGAPGKVLEKHYVEDLDLYQVTFENGVRLNLKKTDFQANSIRMLIRVGSGGLTEPEEKEGVALLASSTFTSGGLGAHSSDELRRVLAGRNVGVGFSVGEDAFQFAGGTTPDDLELQLQLAAAFITDPGYRPEALRLAQNSLRELYRQARHTSEGVLQSEVSRLLASGDYRVGLPSEEAVNQLNLEDVRAWLAKPLSEDYMEVTLVGDLSVDRAIELVGQTLGALPERVAEKPKLEKLRQMEFPEDVSTREYEFESTIPNGITAIYWPTADMSDIRRTRRLQTLARIFSDRMRVRIREEMGDAYSPYAVNRSSDTFEDYGFFYGMVGVDPERGHEVADVVVEIAQSLYSEGVTEDELERALKPTMTSLRIAVRDNSYWLGSVMASSQEQPERLEWARHMMSDYESITVEEITELAHQYLKPEDSLRIFVSPVAEKAAE